MLAEILRFKYIGMKECYRKTTSCNSRKRAAIFVSTSCEERHNKPFWLKLCESTENMQQSPTFVLRQGNNSNFERFHLSHYAVV